MAIVLELMGELELCRHDDSWLDLKFEGNTLILVTQSAGPAILPCSPRCWLDAGKHTNMLQLLRVPCLNPIASRQGVCS